MESSESRPVSKVLFSPQASDVQMKHSLPSCECLRPQFENSRFGNLRLHSEIQDITCEGWKMMVDLVDAAAARNSEEFAPGLEMPPELWPQIVTLPASIAKLKSVRKLYLYRSHLVRIPPEIGEMTNLEELDLYTSYRLHWLPFEVTHCKKLKRSRFSTRALYGNYKYRPPFPSLDGGTRSGNSLANKCSICRCDYDPLAMLQYWISLRVATDVLPLLVNACSHRCIQQLPAPAHGYIDHAHMGGLRLPQPPAGIVPPRS